MVTQDGWSIPHSECAVLRDGAVVCFGAHRFLSFDSPLIDSADDDGRLACGIERDTGAVFCWPVSYGYFDYTDDGATASSLELGVPEGEAQVQTVSPGGHALCSLSQSGSVHCWWSYYDEYLPNVPDGRTYTQLAANGPCDLCGLADNGRVECFPTDWEIKMDGTRVDTCTDDPLGESSFTQIAAGHGRICGVRDDGNIECSGSSLTEAFPTDGEFAAVDVGAHNACGVTTLGTVVCRSDGYECDEEQANADGYICDDPAWDPTDEEFNPDYSYVSVTIGYGDYAYAIDTEGGLHWRGPGARRKRVDEAWTDFWEATGSDDPDPP
jgi:hypothetical protein